MNNHLLLVATVLGMGQPSICDKGEEVTNTDENAFNGKHNASERYCGFKSVVILR